MTQRYELEKDEEEKKIKIDRSEIVKLLDDHKFELVIGTIGGFIYGIVFL
jgi:hypothetical protein